MKIEKITFQKTFPIAPFLNDKVGIEIQLDEGETPESILSIAKTTVENWHKAANPHLYQPSMQEVSQYSAPVPIEINIQDEKKLISIDNATTLEELATLKPGLPQHLMPDYIKKLKALTK